ncbi:MAG: septum formation protein Maf [Deltaproteobacteria bacterium]|nr:septum formation protein Maf [Deltaproteobacteria bacterium]
MTPEPPALILASTSPYRKVLLEQLGIPFQCVAPLFDEERWKDSDLNPVELVTELAQQKALSIAVSHPKAVVIGSDQMAVSEGKLLGKPGSRESAIEQLSELSGKSHELLTAVALCHKSQVITFLNRTRLSMRNLDREQIERYVDADEPWDCAGAYKIESRGISLFNEIETQDHTAIQGLPLIELSSQLLLLGYPIP